MKHTDHECFFNANDLCRIQRGRCLEAQNLPDEAGFTCKGLGLQNRDDGFFALWRNDRELDTALLDIEHGIRYIPLRKESLVLSVLQGRFPVTDLCEELFGVKRCGSFACHRPHSLEFCATPRVTQMGVSKGVKARKYITR